MITLGGISFDTVQFNGHDISIYLGPKMAYQSLRFKTLGKYDATHSHTASACYGTGQCGSTITREHKTQHTYSCPNCGASNTVPLSNWGCTALDHYYTSSWSTNCSSCGESHVVSSPPASSARCNQTVSKLTCSLSSLGYVGLKVENNYLTTDNCLSGATLTSWKWSCKKKDETTIDYGTSSQIKPKDKGTYTCTIGWKDTKTGASRTGTITATTN